VSLRKEHEENLNSVSWKLLRSVKY